MGIRRKKRAQAKRVHSSYTLSVQLNQKFTRLWKAAGFPNRNSAIEGLVRTWALTQGYDHEFALAVAWDSPQMRDRIDEELATIVHSEEKSVLEEIVRKAASRHLKRDQIKKTMVDIIRERASARHVAKKIAEKLLGSENKKVELIRERIASTPGVQRRPLTEMAIIKGEVARVIEDEAFQNERTELKHGDVAEIVREQHHTSSETKQARKEKEKRDK